MRRLRLTVAIAVALGPALSTTSCGTVIEYSKGLRDSKEHSGVVRYTAQLGGLVGFIVGLPASVVAAPVTYPLYRVQASTDPENTDFTSTVLFPCVALLEVGSLIAMPFDLVEFGVYRAWIAPDTPTVEEQEAIELRIDSETLPRYPVEPIYPTVKTGT